MPKTWIHSISLIQRPGKTEFLSLTASSIEYSCMSFKLRQSLSPVDLRMLHQTGIHLPQCGVTCSHAQKLKLKQPVPPTTAVMPVIVLLCVGSLSKWSFRRCLPKLFYDSVTPLVRLSRFPSGSSCFPCGCTAACAGSVLTQLPELICQSTNLTTMNVLFSDGRTPCITTLHGWVKEGAMPQEGQSQWPGAGDGTSPFRGS